MTEMDFIKMHGLGNDFAIVDLRGGAAVPERAAIGALTDRRRGIGCDQFITMSPPQSPQADIFMRIYNAPDGSEAEACGNATRCVASLLMGERGSDAVTVQTVAGLLPCRAVGGDRRMIEADMGIARLGWEDIPLSRECDTLHLGIGHGAAYDPVGVNVGNPHAVFFVEGVDTFPVREIGPLLEHDPLFPRRANIEFAQVLDRSRIRMRVWERDTGETDACGSAACATAVAAVRRGLTERKSEIVLNGGSLFLHWREEDGHILMTGPAAFVYKGTVSLTES